MKILLAIILHLNAQETNSTLSDHDACPHNFVSKDSEHLTADTAPFLFAQLRNTLNNVTVPTEPRAGQSPVLASTQPDKNGQAQASQIFLASAPVRVRHKKVRNPEDSNLYLSQGAVHSSRKEFKRVKPLDQREEKIVRKFIARCADQAAGDTHVTKAEAIEIFKKNLEDLRITARN
ncbi:hypothetical protein [Candidatus Odyssella thessalonicensis]|uniref:hypothetical protein n=1 Tax=Candidatus Odyssella thessalonicensis TaxID=84647 RepID=UPI000225ABCA|nr:hypothetical protein [Candidatus Odyssella thessalonicensis]